MGAYTGSMRAVSFVVGLTLALVSAACSPGPEGACAGTERCTSLALSAAELGTAPLDDLEVLIVSRGAAGADDAHRRLFFRSEVLKLPHEVALPAPPAGATIYVRATSGGPTTADAVPTQLAATLTVPPGGPGPRLAAELRVTCAQDSRGGSAVAARTCTAPPARQHGAMAYDPVARRLVLFGGLRGDGAPLADTWEWDGLRWSAPQTPDVEAPVARSGHALAFDPRRGRLILFGGEARPASQQEQDSSGLLDDTWEYLGSGQGWRRLEGGPRPPARRFAAMTTGPLSAAPSGDQKRQGVVLFGGQGGEGDRPPQALGDTWTFDGAAGRWEKRGEVLCILASSLPGQLPFCRSGAALATVRVPVGVNLLGAETAQPAVMTLLIGGRGGRSPSPASGGGRGDETLWGWDGESWLPLQLPNAEVTAVTATGLATAQRALARISSRWFHSVATLPAEALQSAAEASGAAPSSDERLLISGGESDGGLSPDSFVLDLRRGNLAPVLGLAPSARSGAALAYDAERGEVLLGGGLGLPPQTGVTPTAVALPDTWTFSGQAGWTRRR